MAIGSADVRQQIGALPVRRRNGKIEVCLVTTRETRRWTIPKGWPMKGKTDSAAAAIEAKEEAGLIGKVESKPTGSFLYWKRRTQHLDLIRVQVYRMEVSDQLATWKEASERYVMWFTPEMAASLVDETGLTAMISELASLEA